jgi:hypothetical protein
MGIRLSFILDWGRLFEAEGRKRSFLKKRTKKLLDSCARASRNARTKE